jgi:multidrug resistance efflux pump
MKIFYAVCVSVILVLIFITMALRSNSTSFYGIADAQEIIINDEFSVEVRKINVVPGQQVRTGDTLLEVNRPELGLKIAEISRQLGELRTQKSAHVNLSRSEVLQYKSLQDARVGELTAQIRELEAQLETNKKLMSELRSIKKGDAADEANTDMTNPVTIKIQQLKKELEIALDSSNISMGRLNNQLSYAGDPLAERVKGLQREMDVLLEEKNRSFKVAQISGLIGAVNFKEGDKLSPFTSIMTLHSEAPSYVRGYIHENTYTTVTLGEKVSVNSLADKQVKVAGEVVGVGTRIVEYPVRLRKNPEMQMWGREVTIKIPTANKFLLGEKVLISLLDTAKKRKGMLGSIPMFGSRAYAAETGTPPVPGALNGLVLKDITVPDSMKGLPGIEASGVLFLADIGKYLVISDETAKKRPSLFLMNSSGAIEKETVIAGLKKINDMEGLAEDDSGRIFVLTSQGRNKKGERSAERTLFLRVKRDKETFTLDAETGLSDVLETAARKNREQPWAVFFLNALKDSTLDIEGVAFRQNTLFLGFKNPLLDGNAVILSIGNAGALFNPNAPAGIDIRLWKKMDLRDTVSGAAGHISDLHFAGDTLYVLSIAKKKEGGRKEPIGMLWRYRPNDRRPDCLCRFPGQKPEGVAFNKQRRELLLTFDNGSEKPSQIATVKVDR